MPPFEETRLRTQLTELAERLRLARHRDDQVIFKTVYRHPIHMFHEADCPLAFIAAESGRSALVRVIVWTSRDPEQDEEQLLALHDGLSRYFDLSHSKFEQLFLQGWSYRSFSFAV